MVIGRYENSSKVKCREDMCDVFQWTAEPKTPSRDRVSISPRSCVDFVWCAQAEIVCRFRQVIDWGSLDVGSVLRIFVEVENC